jgi:hypothetical protein
VIEFRVNMTAPSTPNLREHHMAKAKRVKAQRGAVQRNMPKWPLGPQIIVRLTRVSPRELDSDNLQGAFKAIRDQVAAGLLVDDRSPLVAWDYHQAKGEPEVVVQIWTSTEEGPALPVGRPAVVKAHGLRKDSTVKGKRKPSANYTPPEASRMHASAIRAAAESIARAEDLPAVRAVPLASRTNPMSTKALEPSNAAEHLALLAAQEAEKTLAPAERCTPSLPCGRCMDCIGTLP